MSIFGNSILQAIYEKLTANSSLLGQVSGVYDHVPQTESFPFVALGEMVETEFNTDDA